MVKVKICGITNLEDALNAVQSGCDAIGFVFYKKSPRYVTPERAKAIIREIPGKIIKVGVFVDATGESIRNIARSCRLDILQFHGHESAAFCRKFKGYKIIKALRMKKELDLARARQYKVFACLLDTFSKTKFGGTGKRFDWNLARNRYNFKHKLFLSGGLTAQNVRQAIKVIRPDWVDVSSSLEIKPGKKDDLKVKKFIAAVKKSRGKDVTG